MISIGAAAVVVLAAVLLSAGLFRVIPAPVLQPEGLKLQAASLAGRLQLFQVMTDAPEGAPRERWLMRAAEADGLSEGQEIKPFDSVVEFADRLWFFSPGMYRVFDGREWQRVEAPWVGGHPIAAATPAQIWILSRGPSGDLLTSYTAGAWDRPIPADPDPADLPLRCGDPCPAALAVFQEKIEHFWVKDGALYRRVFDGERFGRAESLGPASAFAVSAGPARLSLWYVAGPPSGRGPAAIRHTSYDGAAWREEEGLERSAPLGRIEIAAARVGGASHLVVNTGLRLEDVILEQDGGNRSVLLSGGGLGRAALRYQALVAALLISVLAAAAAALSAWLDRWSPVPQAARDGAPVEIASLWRRFAAKAVDTVIVGGPVAAALVLHRDPQAALVSNSLIQFLASGGSAAVAAGILLLAYHSAAEGIWGRTLGKHLLGIEVVDEKMRPCRPHQAAMRNIVRLADGLALYGVGLITIAATRRRQRLGDLAARTVVIRSASRSSS